MRAHERADDSSVGIDTYMFYRRVCRFCLYTYAHVSVFFRYYSLLNSLDEFTATRIEEWGKDVESCLLIPNLSCDSKPLWAVLEAQLLQGAGRLGGQNKRCYCRKKFSQLTDTYYCCNTSVIAGATACKSASALSSIAKKSIMQAWQARGRAGRRASPSAAKGQGPGQGPGWPGAGPGAGP